MVYLAFESYEQWRWHGHTLNVWNLIGVFDTLDEAQESVQDHNLNFGGSLLNWRDSAYNEKQATSGPMPWLTSGSVVLYKIHSVEIDGLSARQIESAMCIETPYGRQNIYPLCRNSLMEEHNE